MIEVSVSCIVVSLTNCNVCRYFVRLNLLCNALYCAGSLIKKELPSFRTCTYSLIQSETYRMLDCVHFHGRWIRTELSNVIIYLYMYRFTINISCSNLMNLAAHWTQLFVAPNYVLPKQILFMYSDSCTHIIVCTILYRTMFL